MVDKPRDKKSMKPQCIILLFVIIFSAAMCFSAEIDSVTPRTIQLDDSLADINALFNERFKEGVEKANSKQDDFADIDTAEFCDEKTLYRELRKAIFQSLTASWGLKGYDVDKQLRTLLTEKSYSVALQDSIYRDIHFLEGISLKIKELSNVVTIDGHLVGLDKLGHFFAEGWHYFEMTDMESKSIYEALAWGAEKERGLYGTLTTGIFSFADLTANMNGWRFWNKILLKKSDPLKGMIANFLDRPYVQCQIQWIESIKNRKIVKSWVLREDFDLSSYIDGAWDEGNNCNIYEDPAVAEKVEQRIKNISANFSCPIDPEACLKAQKKYGSYANLVLHPSCLTVKKP